MIARLLARLLLLPAALSCAAVCIALPVDEDVSAAVARNWVRYVIHQQGGWGMSKTATVQTEDPFLLDGETLAYLYRIVPSGYVVVPARRELSPVTAYSETTHLPSRENGGFFDLLQETLGDRMTGLSGPSADAKGGGGDPGAHPAWAYLSLPPADFETWLDDEDPEWESTGPMLETHWEQGWPFNLACPMGEEYRTFVGCTGLALAQLIRFHEWPRRGQGSISYWWAGDTHCGDVMDGLTIYANFMVPYNWALMPDTMNWETPAAQQAAVSQLCFNVAAAIRTDFSVCGSSASLSRATSALINYFDFEYGAREYPRFRYTDAAWFGLIKGEIDGGRPILYASTIHSMVCDGWREAVDMQQIHLNYGWGGDGDNWYSLDAIETSANPAAERMVAGIRPGSGVQTLVPALSVVREGSTAILSWGEGSLNPAAGFHVWRGSNESDRVRLTVLALAGFSEYVWIDQHAPSRGTSYWLEMMMGGVPSVWIGPMWLPPYTVADDPLQPIVGPNPFNPLTAVRFALPRDAQVRAVVYDLAGRRVETLIDAALPAGPQRLVWDGRDSSGRHAASGRYLLRLVVDGEPRTFKLTLTR
ncbi:C10 family peptidase [bacterium]|nr:C10 family peptidase [bacterium]MBU1073384.1 C10 family peptidase [bacterium]MBU1675219.1 C10 family peptidase [bacterium]